MFFFLYCWEKEVYYSISYSPPSPSLLNCLGDVGRCWEMLMRGEIFACLVIKICLHRTWWSRFEQTGEKKVKREIKPLWLEASLWGARRFPSPERLGSPRGLEERQRLHSDDRRRHLQLPATGELWELLKKLSAAAAQSAQRPPMKSETSHFRNKGGAVWTSSTLLIHRPPLQLCT